LIRGDTAPNWHNRVSVPVIASRLGSTPSSAVALVGAGDPSSSRLVYSMVIGLVVIGLLLVVLGIWIIRQTRVDLDVLAPLERMGDSEWKKRDRSTQRRMLDEVRPEGARPLAPATQPPSLDDEFELAEHPVTTFSDLGPGVLSEERDPTPIGSDADPVIESVAEPEIEPVAQPEPEADSTPVEQPDSSLVVEPDSSLVVEPDSSLVVEPDSSLVVEPDSSLVVEPDSSLVVEPPAEPVVEPSAEPVVEPDEESAPDPRA
jgi:tetrahydromethanopterin S-methyltransferase subunit B